MVGQRTLDPLILVRIQAPQPMISTQEFFTIILPNLVHPVRNLKKIFIKNFFVIIKEIKLKKYESIGKNNFNSLKASF